MNIRARSDVYKTIDGERDYQDKRWGYNKETSVAEYVLYMEDYIQKARHDLTRYSDPMGAEAALSTIRKIAGLCVACMEQHGIQERKS